MLSAKATADYVLCSHWGTKWEKWVGECSCFGTRVPWMEYERPETSGKGNRLAEREVGVGLGSFNIAPIWTMLRSYQLNRKQIIGRRAHFFVGLPWFPTQPFPIPSLHPRQSGHSTGSCQSRASRSWLRRLLPGSATRGNARCARVVTLFFSKKGQSRTVPSTKGRLSQKPKLPMLRGHVLMSFLHAPCIC